MSETQDYEWIDDCFRVRETRFGLWISVDKEGKEHITALTKEVCIDHTRFHLKGLQEGWENTSFSTYDGTVSGKL